MNRRGRPPSGRKLAPPRQLGRVPDDVWASLVAHVRARGETFTAWAMRHLLSAKKRDEATEDVLQSAIRRTLGDVGKKKRRD